LEKKAKPKLTDVAAPLLLGTAIALTVPFLGFSRNTKRRAIDSQGGICPVCGQELSGHTEPHHKLPISLGGNDSVSNCVVVHAGRRRGAQDCHELLDQRALNGIIYVDESNPEVPINEVPASMRRPSLIGALLKIIKGSG
jgi:hypothetical protein